MTDAATLNHMDHPILTATSAIDPLKAQVEAWPDKVATDFNGRTLTYSAFWSDVEKMGAALVDGGIARQKRVAYLGLNSDLYMQLFYACALTSRLLVPVNWRLAAPEVAYILKDCEAEMLCVDPAFLELVESIKSDCPALKSIVLIEGDHAQYENMSAWRDRHEPRDLSSEAAAGSDVLVQLYTSGTTGFPKGALLTHQSVLNAIAKGKLVNRDWSEWDDTDVSLLAMPCFHVGGTVWGFQSLSNGATCIILDKPDIAQIIQTISEKGITKMFAVPAVLLTILNDPLSATANFSTMEEVYYGASPIPPSTLKRALEAFQCNFVQLYGMTEVSGSITYLPPEDHDVTGTARMASCGKAFPNVDIIIGDADGNEVKRGDVGEILIRCDSIMKGYWNREADTKAAFFGEWYRSGDAGYMDEDGYIYLFDRVKDMIVSGAENIYPAEVEAALMDHPAVKDVAVIGVPDDKWGEAVKAVVVRGAPLEESELITFSKTRIAGFKAPKSVDFVDDLPRNPSGKILKKELRKPYWPDDGRKVS